MTLEEFHAEWCVDEYRQEACRRGEGCEMMKQLRSTVNLQIGEQRKEIERIVTEWKHEKEQTAGILGDAHGQVNELADQLADTNRLNGEYRDLLQRASIRSKVLSYELCDCASPDYEPCTPECLRTRLGEFAERPKCEPKVCVCGGDARNIYCPAHVVCSKCGFLNCDETCQMFSKQSSSPAAEADGFAAGKPSTVPRGKATAPTEGLPHNHQDWAICGWCAGTGKEDGPGGARCPKCDGVGGKFIEKRNHEICRLTMATTNGGEPNRCCLKLYHHGKCSEKACECVCHGRGPFQPDECRCQCAEGRGG